MRPAQWTALETYLLSSRDLAISTTRKTLGYCRALERGGVNLQRPRRDRYDAFIARLKRDGRDGPGIRHYTRAMKHALAWRGISWPDLRLPRAPVSPRALIPDDVVAQLVNYDQGRDELENEAARFAFTILAYVGLRPPSELHDLQLDDFNARAAQLRVWSDKLETYEVLELPRWLADVVVDYIEGHRERVRRGRQRALFLDPYTGRPFQSRDALRVWLQRRGRAVWDRFRPYDLRHFCACWLLRKTNFNVYLVKSFLRHRKLSSTEHYLHVLQAEERRALASAALEPIAPIWPATTSTSSTTRTPASS